MVRTLSDVLIDADKATEVDQIINLWNELAHNKYSYTPSQLWFAIEHIRELVFKVNGCAMNKNYFVWQLSFMLENNQKANEKQINS